MEPEAYRYIALASMAGGLSGVLVMWNRKRTEAAGESGLRRVAVLLLGTAFSACALFAFTKVVGSHPQIYPLLLMVLVTSWVAVVQAVTPLPLPGPLLRVGRREFAILQSPWTGVRAFGALLRNTPLRHLGGRVFLSNTGRDPRMVLRGLRAAEAVHVWALLFCCPWLVYWGLQGRWTSIAWGLAVHVPLNIYPILHLRLVSWRIDACLAKRQRRRPLPSR